MKILGVMVLSVMLLGCGYSKFGVEQLDILEALCSNSNGVSFIELNDGVIRTLSVGCNDMSYHNNVLIDTDVGWKATDAYITRVNELFEDVLNK
jgi:hypothetical protein